MRLCCLEVWRLSLDHLSLLCQLFLVVKELDTGCNSLSPQESVKLGDVSIREGDQFGRKRSSTKGIEMGFELLPAVAAVLDNDEEMSDYDNTRFFQWTSVIARS